MRALGCEILNDIEQMADRACQAVEAHDNQCVAGLDLANELCKRRARARGARTMFFNDQFAPG